MTFQRQRWLLLIALALAASLAAAPVAQGHDLRPPFEVRFPAEPAIATHHNDWGAVRSGGRRHRGNDLMGPKMTGVYAFADGVVSSMGTHPRSGRWLRIEHDDEWTTYYIHLNNDNIGTDDNSADWSLTVAPGVELGTEVLAGQLIGWMGDSGNAEGTKPHLHFELHVHDYPINPYYILREARERDLAQLEWLQAQLEGQLGAHPAS